MLLNTSDAPCVGTARAAGRKGRSAGIDRGTAPDGCRITRAGGADAAPWVRAGSSCRIGWTDGPRPQAAPAVRAARPLCRDAA